MRCSDCHSDQLRKNGHINSKQRYFCKDCHKQFPEYYTPQGYPDEVKRHCLTMYLGGLGFRAIERASGVHHTTVIHWVKQAASALPDAPEVQKIPVVAQLDELQTYVGRKKQALGLDGSR
ncbi:IS1 family transposase [Gloeobacter morelensis]|uniref:IS1 family transposase n=1 Tax=Gloeobacter morelensis MG652769 TaxID=2781736 RepID=A0ABY3PPV7_9CYAN|nr:IS1 family transposase [Gloeobacter morelensis MG652769]